MERLAVVLLVTHWDANELLVLTAELFQRDGDLTTVGLFEYCLSVANATVISFDLMGQARVVPVATQI